MGPLRAYFRARPWQLRLLTGSVALVLGSLGAVVLYPSIRDHRIIRNLAASDPNVQRRAMGRAVAAGRSSAATTRRLIRALDTDDDRQFEALVAVLRELEKFDTPDRDPLHIDHMRAIEIEAARSPLGPEHAAETRELFLKLTALSGRDNRYVRRALAGAAADGSARVRIVGALLAARLRDPPALRKLLGDRDPNVAAAAALDAGLADMADLADDIASLLATAKAAAPASAAAYALVRLRPAESSERICEVLREAEDKALQSRLLHVMGLLGDVHARAAVLGVLDKRVSGPDVSGFPPAMAVLAAGKLKIAAARGSIERILSAAAKQQGHLNESQVLAALRAADRLGLTVRAEVNAICRNYWDPNFPHLLIEAARVLGRQADLPQAQDSDSPTRRQCIETLRLAAAYHPMPASGPAWPVTTPWPSAAAAVALWMLDPAASYAAREDPQDDQPFQDWKIDRSSSAFYAHLAAESDSSLAGDYLACQIGRTGKPEAFELGLGLLPQRGAPGPLRVHNNNKRAAGAMLLALAAVTGQQKRIARGRIRSRLIGGPLGGETDLYVKGSYHCALLILGETERLDQVRALLDTLEFPKRRAATALCAAGDRLVLDWLLADPQSDRTDVVDLLINTGIGDVLAAAAPELPQVDTVADGPTRQWQARILQDYYIIHRDNVRLGPGK